MINENNVNKLAPTRVATNLLLAEQAKNHAEYLDLSIYDMTDIECPHCERETTIAICLVSAQNRHELLRSPYVDLSVVQQQAIMQERDDFILRAANAIKKIAASADH